MVPPTKQPLFLQGENQISRIGWLDMLDFLATTRGDDPNFEYVTMFFFCKPACNHLEDHLDTIISV